MFKVRTGKQWVENKEGEQEVENAKSRIGGARDKEKEAENVKTTNREQEASRL